MEFCGKEAESRSYRFMFVVLMSIAVCATTTDAANYRTQNFIIQAPTPQLASQVGLAAEKYRKELANHWLGRELPPWPMPCPVRVVAGARLAAQGVTTYNRAPVRDFQMEVVGTPERILDSVLPHEVTHTVLATHFGRPLPRWADEGICTMVEHASERSKHEAKLREFLGSRRGIAMNRLFLLTEYPNQPLPMYAQGYSVCRFFIDQKGPRAFIDFLQDYMRNPSWTANVRKHYGYESLRELQEYWLAWVSEGSGPVEKFAKVDTRPSRGANVSTVSAILPRDSRGAGSRAALALNAPAGDSAVQELPAPRGIKESLASRTPSRPGASRPGASRPVTGTSPALQAAVDQGWYSRLRDEAKQDVASTTRPGDAAMASRAITPILPPSVRNSGRYSVSQPQPEQQMSRSGVPLSRKPAVSGTPEYRILNGGPVIRRWR